MELCPERGQGSIYQGSSRYRSTVRGASRMTSWLGDDNNCLRAPLTKVERRISRYLYKLCLLNSRTWRFV